MGFALLLVLRFLAVVAGVLLLATALPLAVAGIVVAILPPLAQEATLLASSVPDVLQQLVDLARGPTNRLEAGTFSAKPADL